MCVYLYMIVCVCVCVCIYVMEHMSGATRIHVQLHAQLVSPTTTKKVWYVIQHTSMTVCYDVDVIDIILSAMQFDIPKFLYNCSLIILDTQS